MSPFSTALSSGSGSDANRFGRKCREKAITAAWRTLAGSVPCGPSRS